MQLAGDDLHDFNVAWMTNLLGGEIESSFACSDASQIDFRLNLVHPQLANQPLGAAHADLGFGNGFGTDFDLTRHMLKDNRRTHSYFGRLLITRDHEPHPSCQHQGQDFESEVMQDVALDECDHDCGSEGVPASDLRCGV